MTTTATRPLSHSRAQIIRRASPLILEHGADAVRLDDILAVCGISANQFFHVFDGKSALVRAVQAATGIEAVASGEISTRLDDWPAIEAWVDQVIRWYEAEGLSTDSPPGLVPSGGTTGELTANLQRVNTFAEWQSQLARGLATMKFSGSLQPHASPYGLAEFVMATWQGGLALARAHDDVEPLANALKHALEHLRANLAPIRLG